MFNHDSRNPSNYTGTVSCCLCDAEYQDDETHYCKDNDNETGV